MKNLSRLLMVTFSASMLFLTGCTEADFDMNQINELSESFEAISSNVDEISESFEGLAEVTDNIDNISGVVEEFSEEINPAIIAATALSEDLTVVSAADLVMDQINEAYEGTPIGNVLTYKDRGAKAIADARAQYEKGVAQFNAGFEGLQALDPAVGSARAGVENVFFYTEEMVKGGNAATEAMSILVREVGFMSSNLIDVAEILGASDNANIENLKGVTDAMADADIQIVFFSPEIIDVLEEQRVKTLSQLENPKYVDDIDVSPLIDEVYNEVLPVAENLNSLNATVNDYYKQSNKAAQTVLTLVGDFGTGDDTLDAQIDEANEILKAFEDEEVALVQINNETVDFVDMASEAQVLAKELVEQFKEAAKEQIKAL